MGNWSCSCCSQENARGAICLESEKLLHGSSLEALAKLQRHPEAKANVVRTLQPPNCCKQLFSFLLALPFLLLFLPLLVPVLLAPVLLFPLWLVAPQLLLTCLGIRETSAHSPEWMLPDDTRKATSPRKPSVAGDEEGTQLPKKLQGVFYLRLSAMPDLACWQRGIWDSQQKRLLLPASASHALTFRKRFADVAIMLCIRIFCCRYEISFDDSETAELTCARIIPKFWCFSIPACVAAFRLIDVSAKQDGSLWERWSLIMGRPMSSYWAERVVDANIAETPFFQHLLDEVPRRCLSFF